MKCNELKVIDDLYERRIRNGSDPYKIKLVHVRHPPVYLKNDVDEAITELKAKLDKTIAERDGNQVCIDALKQKIENVQASMYADVVDANMENRRLKCALWMARAERAKAMSVYWYVKRTEISNWEEFNSKWNKIENLCRAKADEYKETK